VCSVCLLYVSTFRLFPGARDLFALSLPVLALVRHPEQRIMKLDVGSVFGALRQQYVVSVHFVPVSASDLRWCELSSLKLIRSVFVVQS
jgi:hypothetical protein